MFSVCQLGEESKSENMPSVSESDTEKPFMSRSGVVDYFAVCVLEGEKQTLDRRIAKLEKQLECLEEENKSLRQQLSSVTRCFFIPY